MIILLFIGMALAASPDDIEMMILEELSVQSGDPIDELVEEYESGQTLEQIVVSRGDYDPVNEEIIQAISKKYGIPPEEVVDDFMPVYALVGFLKVIIPEDLFRLSDLAEELGIPDTTIQYSLTSNEQNISAIYLNDFGLSTLPSAIGQFEYLETLDLSDNDLTSLPETLWGLEKLENLDLSGNGLTILPAEVGNLIRLTSLELSDNTMRSIPSEIGNLENLTYLNLSDNVLEMLPETLGGLTGMRRLLLGNNRLQKGAWIIQSHSDRWPKYSVRLMSGSIG